MMEVFRCWCSKFRGLLGKYVVIFFINFYCNGYIFLVNGPINIVTNPTNTKWESLCWKLPNSMTETQTYLDKT